MTAGVILCACIGLLLALTLCLLVEEHRNDRR